MKGFLAGVIVVLIAVPLFGFLYIYFGYAPVATAAPPFPFERRIASLALKARIHREAPTQPGVTATPENLMAGAILYREHCAVCHSLPGQSKTPTAQGMYPPPPQLFHGRGVTDDPPGEIYWKITNGIRLTGMPAYNTLSDNDRWQITQTLANADKLPPNVKAVLAQPLLAK